LTPFDPAVTANQPGGSQLLDKVLTAVRNSLRSLAKAVTNDVLVPATIGTVEKRVHHSLGTPPTTWEVVGRDAPEVVYESSTNNPERSRYLLLRASGDVRVTLRFSA
jgi:hypothetical protein